MKLQSVLYPTISAMKKLFISTEMGAYFRLTDISISFT